MKEMKLSSRGRRVLYIRISQATLLPVLICCMGCAGKAKQMQPASQEKEDAAPLVEEFDPRSVREDLLLIAPRFALPSRRTGAAAEPQVQGSRPGEYPVQRRPRSGSRAEVEEGPYRVQVVVLSSETGARQLAELLHQKLGVEVIISPHNGLHAVRAGRCASPEAAQSLRRRIVEMDNDFADAFVLGDPASSVELKPSVPTNLPPIGGGQQDLPGQEKAGGVRSPGWRVLIDQFLTLPDAEEFRRKAVERLDRNDVEINFHEPWYKVEVGQFRAGEAAAAQKLVALVKRRGFPRALKVRGEVVTVPEEAQ